MTIDERLEALELAVEEIIRRLEAGDLVVSLEELHGATVARVKMAKERGGLAS